MNPHDIATKIAEYAAHIGSLLGTLESALKDHSDRIKEIPAVNAELVAKRELLAKYVTELEDVSAKLNAAKAARIEVLKQLGV